MEVELRSKLGNNKNIKGQCGKKIYTLIAKVRKRPNLKGTKCNLPASKRLENRILAHFPQLCEPK